MKINEFIAAQKAHNDRTAAATASLLQSLEGVTQDVKTLADRITALQNSTGEVSPEDQAAIDALEQQSGTLVSNLEGLATALANLDSQTPPPVPTPDPVVQDAPPAV